MCICCTNQQRHLFTSCIQSCLKHHWCLIQRPHELGLPAPSHRQPSMEQTLRTWRCRNTSMLLALSFLHWFLVYDKTAEQIHLFSLYLRSHSQCPCSGIGSGWSYAPLALWYHVSQIIVCGKSETHRMTSHTISHHVPRMFDQNGNSQRLWLCRL